MHDGASFGARDVAKNSASKRRADCNDVISFAYGPCDSCQSTLAVHDAAGSDDFKSVKGDLEKGMEVLEKELALFKVMLQQKKLI